MIGTKWTGDVTQAAEPLLCKCKALNSNPSPTKNKNEKNTWFGRRRGLSISKFRIAKWLRMWAEDPDHLV
jgi:hypothetical protein